MNKKDQKFLKNHFQNSLLDFWIAQNVALFPVILPNVFLQFTLPLCKLLGDFFKLNSGTDSVIYLWIKSRSKKNCLLPVGVLVKIMNKSLAGKVLVHPLTFLEELCYKSIKNWSNIFLEFLKNLKHNLIFWLNAVQSLSNKVVHAKLIKIN